MQPCDSYSNEFNGIFVERVINVMDTRDNGKSISNEGLERLSSDKQLFQDRLRDSQEKLRGVFQNIADGILVVDVYSEVIVDVNPTFCEMLGFSKPDIERMHVQDFLRPHSSELGSHSLIQFFCDNPTLKNVQVIRHDSSFLFVDITSSLIVINDREFVILNICDASVRINGIEDKNNEYIKYHTLFENSHDALLIRSAPFWYVTEANKAALNLFEVDSVEGFNSFLPWDISPLYQSNGQLSKEQGQLELAKAVIQGSNYFEWQYLLPSKKLIFADVLLTKMELSGNIFLLENVRDSTALHAALRVDAELKVIAESEEKFRKIAEMAQDAILLMGPDRCITFLNPAGERMFGYAHEEVLGKEMHPLLAPEANEAFKIGFVNFQKTGTGPVLDRLLELTAHRKNGEIFPVELMVSSLKINNSWHALGIFRDITKRREIEEKIRHMALHDELTQLPNRRLLQERLGQAIISSMRKGYYGALLYIDLDGFKKINDTFGHYAGDCLLIELAQRLTSTLREIDTVARVGGDEFIVLLNELSDDLDKSTKQVSVLAEKICYQLSIGYQLSVPQQIEFHCSSSIGVVLFYKDSSSPEELLGWSDKAMYQAKKSGGNGVSFFSPPKPSDG